MSRSKPRSGAPNPSTRWFEWNGENGAVRYYDKDLKENVVVPLPFTFMLLDEMATVRGWHEFSKSGIYSNEVRDTRIGVLVVKAFKGGLLAEGLYRAIKDKVHAVGAQFVANCYIAYKRDGELAIGSIGFKGSALGAWMEFRKAHQGEIYEKAITIAGFTEGKKGRIVYRMPTFALKDLSKESHEQATALDVKLQEWLDDYTARNTKEQLVPVVDFNESPEMPVYEPPTDEDSIPF